MVSWNKEKERLKKIFINLQSNLINHNTLLTMFSKLSETVSECFILNRSNHRCHELLNFRYVWKLFPVRLKNISSTSEKHFRYVWKTFITCRLSWLPVIRKNVSHTFDVRRSGHLVVWLSGWSISMTSMTSMTVYQLSRMWLNINSFLSLS